MEQDYIVTQLVRVIYVGKEEYPERITSFNPVLESHELIFFLSGRRVIRLDGREYQISSGTLVLMAQGDHGDYTVSRLDGGDCIDIFFRTDAPVFPAMTVRQAENSDRLGLLFQKIFNLWVQREEGYYLRCLSVLYDILAHLQTTHYLTQAKYDAIAPAIRYIEDNFRAGEINCDVLAQRCGISYSYLKRLFHEKYGMPPRQFINCIRLNYAANLLQSKLFSVRQVAQQCGFAESAYFSRQFKKSFGSSPKNYVQKHRSSK